MYKNNNKISSLKTASTLISILMIFTMLFSAVTPVFAQSGGPESTPTEEPTVLPSTPVVEPSPTETLPPQETPTVAPTEIPTESPSETPVVTETPVVEPTAEVSPTTAPTEAPIQAMSTAPANDLFEDADVIALSSFADTIDTTGATVSSTDPTFSSCYYGKGGNSVWYEFTPSSDGVFIFDTTGTNYDTVVGVWTGTEGDLTLVGCNDDIDVSTNNLASKATVVVESDTTYFIEIVQWKETNGISASSLGKSGKLSAFASGGGTLVVNSTYENCYSLTASVNPSAGGTIAKSPVPNCLSTRYKPGTNVTLTLTEKTGYKFTQWNNGVLTKSVVVTMDGNKSIQALLSAAPGVPALQNPTHTSLVSSLTPTLSWSASNPVADHYELEIGTTSKFSTIVYSDDAVAASPSPVTYTIVSDLNPSTAYYWRVRGVSADGTQKSNWSSVRQFRTRLTTPVLISPEITTTNLRPTFSWSKVTGNAGYTLQISTTSNCSSPKFTYQIPTTASDPVSFAVTTSLVKGTNYYWCVTAKGTNPSLMSAPMNFLTPIPPATPTLKTPANGSTVASDVLSAVWNAASGAVTYTLQYDTNANFSTATEEDSIGTTNWTSGPVLLPNKTYYWRVKAVDGASAESIWSNVFSFKTPMAAPVAVAPTVNADMLRPVFSWTRPADNTGLSGYAIQIAKNNTFTSGVINGSITGNPASPKFTPGSDLARSTTYYWRVKANGTRPSGWSNVLSFVTPNPPAIPTPTAPVNGTFFATDYTPTFTWSTVSGVGITYQIQIDDNTSFSSPIDEDGLVTTTYTPGSDLDPNLTYYWRVRASNDGGTGYSLWSAVKNFRTAMFAPVLTSPIDPGDPAMSLRPTFTLNRPANNTGLTGYSFQLATNNTFTTGLVNGTVSGNSATPSFSLSASLVPDTVYYWHVKANGTNPSQWSSAVSFTSPNPPGIPVLSLPASASLSTDYTPLFDWSDASGSGSAAVDHYDIQVSLSSSFSSFAVNDSTADPTSSFTPSSDLTSNKTYYWRVRSVNADGEYSLWSAVWNFRTAMLPPVVISPITNGNALRQVFTWNKVTGATSYTLKFSRNADMSVSNTYSVAAPSSSTVSFTSPVDLLANTTYYWTVAAIGTNSSLPSTPTQFLTPNPPPAPSLTSPANGALQFTFKPTVTWASVPTAAKYTVQIALDSGFTSGVQTFNDITEISYTFGSNLSAQKTYYWHVRSVGSDDAIGSWSSTRYFKTPEVAPVIQSPSDGATVSTSKPHFDWDPAGTATSYTIQVCEVSTCEGSPYWTSTTTGTGATMSTALISGTTYYWRVRGNTTAYTTIRSITYEP